MNLNLDINWKRIGAIISISVGSYYLYKRYVFPALINNMTKSVHKKLHDVKKKAFEEAFTIARQNNRNEPLELLEVGVGSGRNFTLFPCDVKISFLDKTDAFLSYLQKSFENDNRNKDDFKLIVSQGESMSVIESNSKDIVVHTLVLCSVSDPKKVLDEIHRVLKPGGVCVFLEHSLNSENFFLKLIQRLVGPMWLFCFECRFLPIKQILEARKYSTLKVEFHKIDGFMAHLVNPFVYGYAVKEK